MISLLLLLAALAAAAADAPHVRWRGRRDAVPLSVQPVQAADAADAASAVDTASTQRAGEEEAEGEGEGGVAWGAELEEDVTAWRALWPGALEQLRREPRLNRTEDTVVAQLGAAAFLHCPVQHLGERGISWVRLRDWHILSSGLLMYTNDERFQVLHSEGSDDWILQIKYVQKRDNGTYECQVSTARGPLSRKVHLTVAVPEAFILGADEHHVDAGSTISLVCIIEKSPVPPQYVFWYHNARMINYDLAAGVSVRTEPGPKTQSTLAIRRAAPRHSGNYTCRAANTEPAHILVYVSEGSDKMAATLSRSGAPLAPRAPRAPPDALLLLLLLLAAMCVAPL